VIRRIRADWSVVAAAWVLLVASATLLTAGTLYADAVAVGGLRTSVRNAAPVDRSARVLLTGAAQDADMLNAAVDGELDRLVASGGGGDVWRFAASGPLGFATDDPAAKRVTALATRPSIEHHASLAAGRWAMSGATPREATLSVRAAAALGARVGDHVTLVDRVNHDSPPIAVVVVGTWAPDRTDPYWLGVQLDLEGTVAEGSFTTIGPIVVPEADLLASGGTAQIAFDWRAFPSIDRLTTDSLQPLSDAAVALPARIAAALPAGARAQVETNLPKTLAETTRTVLVSRSGVIVLILEFGVVAAYAIVLVAGLLGDRRRTETTLIRSRGGSAGSVITLAFLEATLLAGTAAFVAPFVSLALVRVLSAGGPLAALDVGSSVGLSPAAIGADILGAIAGIVAMTFPSIVGSANLAGVRAAISRPVGRTLGQRLGLDLALVVLAGVALWQLRLYGAPLTRNVRGILGVDPLLVAAPAIGLIAGALLATRLVPRLAEIAERVLVRGRGLVGPLGGRAMARRPLRYTRSALLLMLAVALGTFSIAHVATWTRSQADQAAYRAGASIRVIGTHGAGADPLALGPAYSALPGTTGAMAVDRLPVDSGRSIRGGPLLAVDGLRAGGIVVAPADLDETGFRALLPALAAGRTEAGPTIPASAARIGVVVDPNLTIAFDPGEVGDDLAKDNGLGLTLVLEDGSGRLRRLAATNGFLAGHDQRLTIALPAGGPFRLRALELDIEPASFVGVMGTIEIRELDGSAAPTSNAWTPLGGFPGTDGVWTGLLNESPTGQPATYRPPADRPGLLTFGTEPGQLNMPSGSGGVGTVRLAWLPNLATIPAVVNPRFLELTSAAVGDELPVSVQGSPIRLRIVGTLTEFPTLDPGQPFVLVDGPTLAVGRYLATGSLQDPGEWWIATSDSAAAAAAIAGGPDPGATVVERDALLAQFATDPSALGVIGLLGIGSAAAMLFAAIGFVVSAAVSTGERAGELALLRALGLSAGQASRWLSLEHTFLLTIGVVAGIGLGVLLAWLVLPFATLTSTGEPAVPSPAVLVPIDGLLPIVAVALAILVLTTLALRRRLGDVRIGEVLRARAE